MLWAIALFLSVLVGYVFFLRPILVEHPTFAPFFAFVEPIESALWKQSRTIFAARLLTLAGALVSFHDLAAPFLGMVDITPFVPPAYAPYVPVVIALIGVLFEWLRRLTAPLPTQGK